MRVLAVFFACLLVAANAQEPGNDLEWWQETVIYQIYPRSYMDSNGDGIGDLNGITSKLEYIKSLGISAFWLSPIFKSPMYDFGYDIADFYAIQDEYGTMQDFENLLAKAKELDMKVILDFVPNHSSNESMWFEEALKGNSTYYNYFVWDNGTVGENGQRLPPNNWVSAFRRSAWEYREELGQYYLHQFAVGQPDLNYRNPILVAEMKNVLRFWLEKGVAGFRVDAINHLFEVDKQKYGGRYPDEPLSGFTDDPDDYDYLDHIYSKNQDETYHMVYDWRDVLDEFKAKDGISRVMMTENYAPIDMVMRYFGDEQREGAQVPFNFALISNVNGQSSAHQIKVAIDMFLTYKPLNKVANWVIGNHDNSRVGSRYGSELIDGMNMLSTLLPGVSVSYMGEEIGMVDGYVSWEDTVDPSGCNTDDPINYWKKSRDPERTPFQWNNQKNAGFSTANRTWLPVAEGYASLNVETELAANRSHIHVYKSLLQLRKTDAIQFGRFDSIAFNSDVFAFKRWHRNDVYIVIINFKNNSHVLDLTYFENAEGSAEVIVASIHSPLNQGNSVQLNQVPVSGKDSMVLKVKN